ncbi:hypothetical protein V5O48_007473 [Marasmius crinis-equi]|uniref:Uncharacterized protein n=1 Tax=Marasmius crinis-equi TaxID=585013 RepID=A0ABR3FGQ2_9AGAR
MFSRTIVLATLGLALLMQVHGHAIVSPALGITGEPVRKDAQRIGSDPCSRTNIAKNIDSSKTITPKADGSITMTINNFNANLDGSRRIFEAKLDTTGTGKSFDTRVDVSKNGEPRPKEKVGSEEITVQMPKGAKCTGGASGNLCLMRFMTLSGFGNCVVVKQGGANGGNNTDPGAAGGAKDGNNGAVEGGKDGAGDDGKTSGGAKDGQTGAANGANGTAGGASQTRTSTGTTGASGTNSTTGTTDNEATGMNDTDTTDMADTDTIGMTGTSANGRKNLFNVGGSRAARALIHGYLD